MLRFCGQQNSARSDVRQVLGPDVTQFAIVRDPVDRFLSGFADKCLKYCDFFDNYEIIKYRKGPEGSTYMADQLDSIFQRVGIPKAIREKIHSEVRGQLMLKDSDSDEVGWSCHARRHPEDTSESGKNKRAHKIGLEAANPSVVQAGDHGIQCASLDNNPRTALELVIKYTNCITSSGNSTEDLNEFSYPDGATQCHLSFSIPENYSGDVKFYYGLRRFYQNNQKYVESRNDRQLIGHLDEVSGCDPLDYVNGTNITYVPCGFIANSMFNDSFQLLLHGEHGGDVTVPFTTRNVVADVVRKKKFRNPVLTGNESLCDAFEGTARPPWWQTDICKLGAGVQGVGVGFENVDFMVWMQAAALPNFRKRYRNLDREVDGFQDGLPAGTYTLVINYITWKGGEKSFIITRESWAGSRSEFLAFAYIAVGVFLLLVSILFLVLYIRHRIHRKRAEAAS
ncbi:unnamed protein product [Nippostrongylus brasiliensis]|uniref:Uncharacterized protein n=1 Tax=Nippostrongylus brasiliensis TaxID=27835 RepID=A0A3P7CXB8_NIPBR|nr:unnamed protein product [Nippostrongylus brasiliensis]